MNVWPLVSEDRGAFGRQLRVALLEAAARIERAAPMCDEFTVSAVGCFPGGGRRGSRRREVSSAQLGRSAYPAVRALPALGAGQAIWRSNPDRA